MKNFRVAIVVLVAILLIVLTETGRTAVNRHYDYEEMTAPKSLHQLSQEARSKPDDRSDLMLAGAGFFALLVVGGGSLLFFALGGQAFGRRVARGRRRPARPYQTNAPLPTLPNAPRMRVLPPAPQLAALPSAEEGHYEEDPRR